MKSAKSLPSSLNISALVGAVLLAFTSTANAASSTWNMTSGTNAWATSTDWVGSVTPGATIGSTTNSDTATFISQAAAQTVTVDSGRNIMNISISANGANVGTYTFSGGPLVLSSGGSITEASGAGETFISAPITLEGSYTFSAAGNVAGNILNISGAVSAANTGTTLTLTGAGVTANNVISGALKDGAGQLSLDKEGVGGWLVEGSNTYTGTTTINGGTLQLGAGGVAGSFNSSSSVTIGALGTLNLSILPGNIFPNAVTDNGNITVSDVSTLTVSGLISGTGSFTMNAGAGVTILTGTNTYTGITTVSAGTLQIGNGTSGSISSTAVSVAGTLAFDMATGSTFSTAIPVTGTVKGVEGNGITNTISSTISSTGGFTQAGTGTGTTILSGSNSYTGTTTVTSGELQLSGAGTLGATTAALTINGGTLDLNGTSQTVGLFSGTGGTIIGTGQTSTLTIDNGTSNSSTSTYAGVIANNNTVTGISLVKVGNGLETLTGSNTYSGQTLIQGGVLDAVDGTGLPTGSLLNISNGVFGSSGTGAGSFVRSLGTTTGTVEITGGISGFSADLGNLTVALGGTSSPTPITWGQGTFNPSLLVLNGLEATGNLSFENALAMGSQNRVIETAANTANFDGALTSTGGGFTKIGAGTLVLTSTNNTYSGGTAVDNGVVSVAALSSIGSGSATVYNTGELRLASASNVAPTQKVVVNSGGILGLASNTFTQANLVSLVDPSSSGILAIDTAGFSNALNLATIGNGGMSLGSSIGTSAATGGVYSASSLTIAPGGTAPTAVAPLDPAIFGGTYRLGGGGGWLTITGLNALTDQPSAFLGTNLSNALFTQGNGISPSTPVTYSATSNTRNSLQVGQYGANGPGTLDLANNQSFTGLTTVNAASTLVLDYSGVFSTTPSNNILNPNNEVDLAGGTLKIVGNATTAASQTLSSVGLLTGGADTITATDNGGNLTVNLGSLNASPRSIVSTNSTTAVNPLGSTGVALLVQQVGTGGTTTIETTTASSTTDTTYGGQAVYESPAGTYTWASGTTGPSTGGLYVIGAYTADTLSLPASGASSSVDYTTAGVTFTAPETINLLRDTGGTLNGTSTNKLTINGGGILFTGSAAINVNPGAGGYLTSGTAANSGGYNFLNLENYTTSATGVNFNNDGTAGHGHFIDNGTGAHLVVVYGGTGLYTISTSNLTFEANTGGAIINPGVNLQMGSNGGFGGGNELVEINGGTLSSPAGSGTYNLHPFLFNGNFTLGAVANAGAGGASLGVNRTSGDGKGAGTAVDTNILGTNVVITVNQGTSAGFWTIGATTDNGWGYGMTINFVSGTLVELDGDATGANGQLVSSTFTGPLTLEGVSTGSILLGGGSTNRDNVINIQPGINITTASGNTSTLAGLNDLGLPSSSSTGTITGGAALSLWGTGNYSYSGSIQGASSIAMNGTGTQTLTGSNTTTGAVVVNAGALILDGSKGGSLGANPAAATNALTVAGGTFAFKGTTAGSTQKVASITDGVGGGTITVDNNGGTAGATILNLGALTLSAGGTLDVVATNSSTSTAPTITTTSANLVGTGTIGSNAGHVLYTAPNGAVSWATGTTNATGPLAGTNTIGAYTLDTTVLVTSGGGTAVANDYLLTASQTQTAAATASLLRITNTTAGSLNLAGKALNIANNGVLFNGTASYSITDTGGGSFLDTNTADKELVINNFGTGTGTSLTISAPITNNGANINALIISGPGTTVLTGSNTYGGTTYLNNGTINFNKLANFGAGAGITISGATLQYATGNTQDMSVTASGKTITINDSGATIDTNGNSMTYASTFGTGSGGVTFVDSASSHGTLNFNGSSGYTGFTTIGSGANVNLGGSGTFIAGTNALAGTIVANGGTLSGGMSQVTNNVQGTGAMAGKITLQSGGVLAPGNLTLLGAKGINGIQNTGTGDGSGNQNQSGVGNNVLNATSLTWNAGGQLKFFLDSNPQQGTILAPSASTLLNLGTGALVKGNGTGGYVLNFQNTGAYNTTPTSGQDFTNVYDLINFGVTNTYGVLTANTTFNIDDFSIVNLNGIGTLSFYYNSLGDNGAGQEELLLTVVPEPSTWTMLLGGLVALVFWTRKRSRRTVLAKSK